MIIFIKNVIDIELGEHEYYYSDIIGCTVFKDDDTPIGRVINIFETGANDVWVVKGEKSISFLILKML